MSQHLASPYLSALNDPKTHRELSRLCRKRSVAISVATVTVVLTLFGAGMFMILLAKFPLNLFGAPILAWAMVLANYLAHDCSHNLVFRQKWQNNLLGECLFFLNGLSYFRFADYTRDHARHHIEKVDLLGVDLNRRIGQWRRPFKTFVLGLEYFYVPIVYFIVQVIYITDLLNNGNIEEKRRIHLTNTVYLSVFVLILFLNPWGLFWVAAAVFLRIHFVRFVDAFQHSYDEIAADSISAERRSRDYEQMNTFSFPVARRHTALNLLILNFGYHNAHHAMPSCPWYRLPELDQLVMSRHKQDVSGACCACDTVHLPMGTLLRQYHRYRTSRITSLSQGSPYIAGNKFDPGIFTGAFTDNLLG